MSKSRRHKKQSSKAIVNIIIVLVVLIVIVKIFDKGNKNPKVTAAKPSQTQTSTISGNDVKSADEKSNTKDANADADKENAKSSNGAKSNASGSSKSKAGTKKGTVVAAKNKKTYLAELAKAEEEDKRQLNALKDKKNRSEYNSYSFWDEKLNNIFGELKQSLPKEKVTVLENSQARWIGNKDEEAKKLAVKNSGDKNASGKVNDYAEITKERCYFIVNNYVK